MGLALLAPHSPQGVAPQGPGPKITSVGFGDGASPRTTDFPYQASVRLPRSSYTASPFAAADLRPMVLGPTAKR